MDTFVIRIYRREPGRDVVTTADAAPLAGIVEDAATGIRHSFHDATELWRVLSGADLESIPARRKGDRARRRKPE